MKRLLWGGLILVVVLIFAGCRTSKSPSKPTGPRYLYALNNNYDKIFVFKINSNGTLEQVNEVDTNDGPGCAVVHPDRNHLFVSTSGSEGDFIEIYGIDENDLSLINAIKMPANGARQLRMVLSPNGEYLFVAHEEKNLSRYFGRTQRPGLST
ncbi:MAG: lactonase family protein [Firmicutes bacterium]|nr:lactonase family protein [Bacillota bacterium]